MRRLQFPEIHILVPHLCGGFHFEKKNTITLQSFERLEAQNAQTNYNFLNEGSQFKIKFVYLFGDEN